MARRIVGKPPGRASSSSRARPSRFRSRSSTFPFCVLSKFRTCVVVAAARGARVLQVSAPPTRGAERRETRGLAKPPGAAANHPGTLARRAASLLRSRKARLPALCLRRSHYGAGPRFQQRAFALPSASSWQEAVVPPGGAPTPPECAACEVAPAGAAPAKARNCRAPATEGVLRQISSASFDSSRLTTPHEAPLGRTRCMEDRVLGEYLSIVGFLYFGT